MNRMRKKIIIKAVLGFLLGLLIGVIFMMAEGKPETYLGLEGTPAVVLYMLCCAAYGLAVMTGQILYDIETLYSALSQKYEFSLLGFHSTFKLVFPLFTGASILI